MQRGQNLATEFGDKQIKKQQDKRIEQLGLTKDFETKSFDERRELLRLQREQIEADTLLSTEQQHKLLVANAKASTDITKLEFEEKQRALGAYANALSAFSSLLGKETAAGKGLAVAASLINTYAAIAAQLKASANSPGAVVPGYAIAQAVATGVQGFMAVKEILAVKTPGGGGGGSAPKSMPTAPTFNVVGGSETTQLAAAIGEQEQQPVQAFVVSQDVTSAQSLENNIIEGATIGG